MKKENKLHQFIKKLAGTRFNSRWLSVILHRIDPVLIKITDGRFAISTLLTGIPYIELITTGAKSGLERKSPLFAIVDGDTFILIASSFGRKNNPAWYYNLVANPKVKIIYKGKTGEFVAREAVGEERDRYWLQAVEVYGGYANYAKWAHHRKIPVMVLEPLIK